MQQQDSTVREAKTKRGSIIPTLKAACERRGFRMISAAAQIVTVLAGDKVAAFAVATDMVRQVDPETRAPVEGGIVIPIRHASQAQAFDSALRLFSMTRGAK